MRLHVTIQHLIHAGWYLPFDDGFPSSDHRMLWVDLCYEDILGEARIEFVTPRARRVTSLMPRQAEKYVEEVRAGYQSENLIERIRKLEAAADAHVFLAFFLILII